MSLNRTFAIVLRQFYLVRGSPARVLPLFAWVGIDMVLWGFITRYLNAVSSAGFDFVPVLLGAVLLWDFFTRVMHGVTIAFMEDVWSRNFLNLLATLPTWMKYFSRIVPPSYVFENVRAIISGHAPSVNALIWSVVLAVIYVLLACWVFTGVYRHSVRTGLVARYSAETVS